MTAKSRKRKKDKNKGTSVPPRHPEGGVERIVPEDPSLFNSVVSDKELQFTRPTPIQQSYSK